MELKLNLDACDNGIDSSGANYIRISTKYICEWVYKLSALDIKASIKTRYCQSYYTRGLQLSLIFLYKPNKWFSVRFIKSNWRRSPLGLLGLFCALEAIGPLFRAITPNLTVLWALRIDNNESV